MGQAAFTVAGQIVGAYFTGGSPIGAAIGGAIGSAIGGALFPTQLPTVEGPRLDDLSVQSSTYGRAIPIPYGTIRVAGNMIWSSGLRETRTETELGGKGSGPQQSQVSYSYDADFAIALAEGVVGQIRRMWFNGVQIYDNRPPAEMLLAYGDLDTVMRARAASIGLQEFFVFYPGDTMQLPDPTMEAALGVGNVPAYRGTAYIVFTRYPLAMWGNRLPQVEIELVTDVTVETGGLIASQDGLSPWFRHSPGVQSDYIPVISDISDGVRVFGANNVTTLPEVKVYGLDGTFINSDARTDWEENFPPLQIAGATDPTIVWVMAEGGVLKYLTIPTTETPFYLYVDEGINGIYEADGILPEDGANIGGIAVSPDRENFMVFFNDGVNNDIETWALIRYAAQTFTLLDQGTVDFASGNQTTTLAWGTSPSSQYTGFFSACMLESDLRHLWRYADSTIECWELDDLGEWSRILSFGSATGVASSTAPAIHCDNGVCVMIAGSQVMADGSLFFMWTRDGGLTADIVYVSDIVADQNDRVGSTAYDVTDLGATRCRGFVVGKPMSARSAIEALMRGFNFDAGEDGEQILFRLRNHDPTIEIGEDDLGAGSEDSEDSLVDTKRAQETELPQEVTVLYFDEAADFIQGAQAAHRTTVRSIEKSIVELPIVMTAEEAQQAADVLLYQAWASRNQRAFSTSLIHSEIIPTDTLTLTADGFSVVVRVTKRNQEDSLIKWEALDVDPAKFSSNLEGVALPPPPVMSVLKPSRVQVMDIPALRADDNDAGVYLAGYPTSTGTWQGEAVLASGSLSGPFQKVAEIFTASAVGYAEAYFPPFVEGNVFDTTSELIVQMVSGAPVSATELEVLNGANVGVIGDEIIQWKTAISLGDDRYQLTGLLRGRRATEAEMYGHAAYERFVWITTTQAVRLTLGSGVIGTSVIYRPVTFAGNANPTFDVNHRHIGASLLPAAPCNVEGVRVDGEGVVIRWQRRDRLSWDLLNESDISLSETDERYQVVINPGTGSIRIINDWPLTEFTYTLAMEAEDWPEELELLAILDVEIYQLSSAVGRGFPAAKTITGLLNF